METLPFLCEELRLEILSWLPVKSLVRFKCVSQSWKSIISDSQFIKLHLHRSSSTRTNADFAHLRSLITSPPESRSATTTVAIPRYVPDDYYFSGTCNGLICLRIYGHENDEYLYLQFRFWNPATRSMSQHSPPLYFPITCNCYFGFGYDSSTDTYKVVVAMAHFASWETTVHVFNMGDDTCWRTIQVSHLLYMYPEGDAVYVNNTLNWLAILPNARINGNDGTEQMNTDDQYTIFSFDLGKNCAQLSLPYYPSLIDDSFMPILGVLRGCLSICRIDNNLHLVVWQMKEFGVHKSWTLLFNIAANESMFRDLHNWHLYAMYMYMSENGDSLLLSTSRESKSKAVLYTQKHNKLELINIAKDIVDCYANNYMESLVSPC